MKRMTDERLAEIDEAAKHLERHALVPQPQYALMRELLQALKAERKFINDDLHMLALRDGERIAELEARNYRLIEKRDTWIKAAHEYEAEVERLEARLDAVAKLPEKWREEENSVGGYMAANNGYTCANELEAALGGDDE